uniref:Uncharacterized protein LOC101514585 n=1 Tax=Cicer arietinum TaxID=3827 RepID=A0A1S3E6H1_CICAR|nr:uncharacterized protein LOC101514585 [Cicer arietinum]
MSKMEFASINKFHISHVSFFVVLLYIATIVNGSSNISECNFHAIFNFGDSNSDTGGLAASLLAPTPPYGETYFHRPVGRFSDGRLVVDFIAESFGLPYLSAYLDSLGTNFSHGANFATAGSTIRPPPSIIPQGGYSPFYLDVQYTQFKDFKPRTQFIRQQGGIFATLMPKEEYFQRALYTFDIGQNDLGVGFSGNMTIQQVNASVLGIIKGFSKNVKDIYNLGARSFWIHNTGPIGCLPYILGNFESAERDEFGCAKQYNEVAQYFNLKLKEAVDQIREEFPQVAITYVDIYSAKYSLFTNPIKYGFEHPLVACCGYGGKYNYSSIVRCGGTIEVNGTQIFVGSCKRPYVRVNWDGAHYTEAANKFIFQQISSGAFSDPPIPLNMACHRNSIQYTGKSHKFHAPNVFNYLLMASFIKIIIMALKHNAVVSLIVIILFSVPIYATNKCSFPAIFNFGASNSDTGGFSSSFFALSLPYGETYFHRSTGRFSDGRIILDFIAQNFGLPYLSSYLNSLGSNFTHGANFATAGSTIRIPNSILPKGRFSPFSLAIQYMQFRDNFIPKTKFIRDQGGVFATLMPKEDYFSKALYTFDIGQNDLTAGFFSNATLEQVNATIPDMVNTFIENIKNIYKLGARSFWIHNTGPIGCTPLILGNIPSAKKDRYGCAKQYNEVSQHFNLKLKEALSLLRNNLPQAAITYVDIYSAKLNLFINPKKYGFKLPHVACCGYGGKYNYGENARCGDTININGANKLVGSCKKPYTRVIWDGTHYTQAANKAVFDQISTGAFTDPPIPLNRSCHRKFKFLCGSFIKIMTLIEFVRQKHNLVVSLIVVILFTAPIYAKNECRFPAIFNFGASNSDTGGFASAFFTLPYPFGETYFHRSTGRFSDGRIILDFIAQNFGLPYLSSYLNSVGSNFTHGASFSTASSTIRIPDSIVPHGKFSPFSLEVQYGQFKDFIPKTKFIRDQGGVLATLMPKEDYFSKALYTFDIGQNDLMAGFTSNATLEQVNATIPDMVNTFIENIKNIYNLGARSFWIHNTGPSGCTPETLVRFPEAILDSYGCAIQYNEVCQHFNLKLKKALSLLRKVLPLAAITYVDIYTAKLNLFIDPKKYGFELPHVACCGYGGKYNYNIIAKCGAPLNRDGFKIVGSCKTPSTRVIWDGTHYTEAANKAVFDQISTGAFTYPPIPLNRSCQRI